MKGINFKILVLSTIIALVSTFAIWQIKGLLVFIIIAVITYISGKLINNKIGGITGDTLGATDEIMEVIVLLSISILERVNLWII